jgi:hypothetical protein
VTLPDNAPLLARTLQHLKGYTAQQANRLLQRTGRFWHRESYDHIVRDVGEMERIISYVLENPVKAGLTTDWQLWPHILAREVTPTFSWRYFSSTSARSASFSHWSFTRFSSFFTCSNLSVASLSWAALL